MAFQNIFKRYELKYMITTGCKDMIIDEMSPYMKGDSFGKSTVRNLYYDTDTFILARRSAEKPVYKEKLRLRSYSRVSEKDNVFVELKRKYDDTVYKRRLHLPYNEAVMWMNEKKRCGEQTQISSEVDYFLSFYDNLRPVTFLSYDREAFYSRKDDGFRVTFDENILARTEDLSLSSEIYGKILTPQDTVLMEIKCAGAIPMWMVRILSRERIYKTSFSKYGTAYKTIIYPQIYENNNI